MMIMNFFGMVFALKFHFEKEKQHLSIYIYIYIICNKQLR